MTKKTLKKFLLIFLLALSFLPFYGAKAESSNVGFIPANIWYSVDPFQEGDKIKIYTLVFNPEVKELSGNVIFFDEEVILGKKEFKIPAQSLKDLSVDWTVTAGKHKIFAKIENARFLISTNKYEDAYLKENETAKSIRTVSVSIKPKTTEEENNKEENTEINSITTFIQEKTPDFISKPIMATTNALENFRENVDEKTIIKTEEIKQELDAIKKLEIEEPESQTNKTQKPLKNLELFVLQLASFIFSSQYIFYTILFVLVFLVLRYIWLKIF
ncbi:MAG: hypothetical protein ABH956_01825 [Candidatus Nealsonbacteria bacterium]